jgi:hypothetical protein
LNPAIGHAATAANRKLQRLGLAVPVSLPHVLQNWWRIGCGHASFGKGRRAAVHFGAMRMRGQ